MSAAELTQIDFVKSINDGYEKLIEREEQSTPSNRPYCYASGYEICDRKLVLQMTQGDKVLPFPTDVKAKFRRGRDRERNLIFDLSLAGRYSNPPFEIIGQQERFELKDHKGRIAIAGKVDFRFDFGRGNPKPPAEVKDFHTNITDRLFTFDDVLRGIWTRKAARQLLCYLYGSGESMGILVLTRPGLPRLIPVYLEEHLDLVEDFLTKAEKALDHKEAGTIPDYINDPAECKRCSFYGSVCNPPIMSGEGAQIFTDPEEEEKLKRMLELEEAADEFASIEKWAKDRFRGIEQGICGSVIIGGNWQRNTVYPLSDEAKKQIEEIRRPFKQVVEKGKWFPSFAKV